jgi:hypothetical protein
MLYSHLLLVLPSVLFPSGFPTKTLYTSLLSPTRATCSAQFILLDLIAGITFGEQYRSLSSSLCSYFHSPVTSSLLGPNILLSTLFSNTLSLRSSLNMSDQVSHPYKTRGKIMILSLNILQNTDDRQSKEKHYCTKHWRFISWYIFEYIMNVIFYEQVT